jgi:hypothetical protein
MERNVDVVRESEELRQGARALVDRSVELAQLLIGRGVDVARTDRGGRKAHALPEEVAPAKDA